MDYKLYKIHHSRGKSDTNFYQEQNILNGAYSSLKVLRVSLVNELTYIPNNRKLDMIKLNVSNNDVSTLAHELFHKIDEKNKITKNNDLRKYIEKDLKRIGTNRESFINEISKYDINAFTINKLGKYELKEKYRGISDIINGYTDGRVKLG